MKSYYDVVYFKPTRVLFETNETAHWELAFVKRLRRNKMRLDGFAQVAVDICRIRGSYNPYDKNLSKRLVRVGSVDTEREEAMKHLATIYGFFAGLFKLGGPCFEK